MDVFGDLAVSSGPGPYNTDGFYNPCNLISRAPFQEQFSEVLDAMFEVLVKPNEHIIDQGDDGDNFYVIERSRIG